mmetsp:Transcript_5447/g.10241  ORF Transcript_5447/g.10241 Transcript_5447/m.10241 type:complete len:189 (-) Transcript_5447:2005-2571(-)
MDETELFRSWHDYIENFGEGPLGRGFYALQLYQWMKELNAFGRDPRQVLKIVRLEDLKDGSKPKVPARILQEMVEWLLADDNSSPHSDVDYTQAFRQSMKTNYDKLGNPVLSKQTREWLEKFYEPHNQMLARLLKDQGWDYSRYGAISSASKPVVWPASRNNVTTGNGTISSSFFQSHWDFATTNPCH